MKKWERLGENCRVLVTPEHTFTTDTLLLAHFSAPKKADVCADFGTGCGTIALLWAARQSPKKIYGIELQEQAFEQALQSQQENGFEGLRFIHADIRECKTLFSKEKLNVIACNPPYKARGAGLKNPTESQRIARHEEELTLEELAKAAAFALKFGGRLCICQRPERLTDAMNIFRNHGLEPKCLRLVQPCEGRAPSLFLLECRRGGNPGLSVQPTLIIGQNGEFSSEMIEIYGDYRKND